MTPIDVVRFSAGALRGHGLRTALSLLGVAVGVTAVILLTSLGEGARRFVTGEFAALGTNLVIVLPGRTETTGFAPVVGSVPRDLTLDDAEAIGRRVPQVRRVAPLSIGQATIRYRERSRDVLVAGTTADWLELRNLELRIGRFLPGEGERDRQVCVIGRLVQEELFPGVNPLGEFLRIGDERYRVIGVTAPRGVSVGMDMDDIVMIPVSRHMQMFNRTSLFRVFVEVAAHTDIESARAAIITLMTARHGEEDVTILTQDSVLATFSRILGVLTAALVGIAAISLTVAGVGIMNVMLVSVAERRREIGLIKAVGATPRQILLVFLIEGMAIATAGGLAGIAVAGSAAAILRLLFPAFPIQAPGWAAPAAIGVSLAVGVLFSLLPARRAARLDPVAALARHR